MSEGKSVSRGRAGKQVVDSGFSGQQEEFIRGEITRQLIALKKQIDVEIAEDTARLEKRLLAAVTDAVGASDRKCNDEIAKVRTDVDSKMSAAKNQIVANNSQLATIQESTRNMIQAVGQQITNATYKKVVAEINRELVPKLNGMVEYVNYQMQDSTELVTDYRRAVHSQSKEGQKMLTDGNDKHILSEHVSMFFTENE